MTETFAHLMHLPKSFTQNALKLGIRNKEYKTMNYRLGYIYRCGLWRIDLMSGNPFKYDFATSRSIS